MQIENKSSSYPEMKPSKRALCASYNQLWFIWHSSGGMKYKKLQLVYKNRILTLKFNKYEKQKN
tara:strand:+ start:22 stop:213 length:192 start_codon:yes stop_codon:yes gene_type:complete